MARIVDNLLAQIILKGSVKKLILPNKRELYLNRINTIIVWKNQWACTKENGISCKQNKVHNCINFSVLSGELVLYFIRSSVPAFSCLYFKITRWKNSFFNQILSWNATVLRSLLLNCKIVKSYLRIRPAIILYSEIHKQQLISWFIIIW